MAMKFGNFTTIMSLEKNHEVKWTTTIHIEVKLIQNHHYSYRNETYTKPPLFIQKWNLYKMGLKGSFQRNKWLIKTLGQLKAATDKNHVELVKRKHVIFYQNNTSHDFIVDQVKTVLVLCKVSIYSLYKY